MKTKLGNMYIVPETVSSLESRCSRNHSKYHYYHHSCYESQNNEQKLERQLPENIFHSKWSLQAHIIQNTQPTLPSCSPNNLYLSLPYNFYQWNFACEPASELECELCRIRKIVFIKSFSRCQERIGINKFWMNGKLSKKKKNTSSEEIYPASWFGDVLANEFITLP